MRIYFLKTSLKSFIFLLYPWKFKTKQSSTLDIPQNCVRSLKNSKAKNKDSWKSHIIFSCSHLEIRLHLINPLKFHMLFLWYPWKYHPPVWIFSGIAQCTSGFLLLDSCLVINLSQMVAFHLGICSGLLNNHIHYVTTWQISHDFSLWFLMEISRIFLVPKLLT